MAFNVSVSSSLYAYIAIYPNTNDDWSSTSPFSGYDLSEVGEVALVLGTLDSDTFTTMVRVPSKLLSITNIDKGINIFEGKQSELKAVKEIQGIGGVALSGSFEVEMENSGRTVTVNSLVGRKVKLVIGNGTTLKEIGTDNETLFTGKIFSVNDSGRFGLKIDIRSNLSLWDKEIGTLTESESTIYNSSIIPMVYGDFSDDFAYVPIVMDKDFRNFARLILDERKLNSLINFYCWDKESKTAYTATNGTDSIVGADNNTVDLCADYGLHIINSDFNSAATAVAVFNPPYVIFQLSGVYDAPTEHTSLVRGTIYFDSANNTYEYLGRLGGYYKFTCVSAAYLTTAYTGSLYKITGTGSGDAELTFVWRSAIRPPEVDYDAVLLTYEPWTATSVDIPTSTAQATGFILKIEDELILVSNPGVLATVAVSGKNGYYSATGYVCSRGYNNTTAVTHVIGTPVSRYDAKITGNKWLVKHKFMVQEYTGVHISPGNYEAQAHFLSNIQNDMPVHEIVNSSGKIRLPRHSSFGLPFLDVNISGRRFYFTDAIYPTRDVYYDMCADLIFPKVTISGEILNMYVIGCMGIVAPSYAPSYKGEHHSSLTIGLGGKTLPRYHTSIAYAADGYGGIINTSRSVECKQGVGSWVYQPNYWPAVYTNTYDFYNVFNTNDPLALSGQKYISVDPANGIPNGLQLFHTPFFATYDEASEAIRNTGLVVDEESRTLYNTDLDFDGLLGNINTLNSTRYFLIWSHFCGYHTASLDTTAQLVINSLGFLIHFYVDPTETPFYTKVYGREFDALISYFDESASGMIENAADVIEDILRREVGLTDTELDETSFDAVRILRDGWKLAAVIQGEPVLLTQLLNDIAKEFGLIVYETRDGKVGLNTLSIPACVSRTILDAELLINDSVVDFSETYTSLSNLFTDVNVNYARNHADESFGYNVQTAGIEDLETLLADVEDFTDETVSATIDFEMIRD